jgi:hypothetical protein
MNTKDLRENLYKTMLGVQDGTVTTKEARSITKIASQIVYSKRLDIESKKLGLDVMKATKANTLNIKVPSADL